MRVECTIDGKALTLSISSDKPLSLILSDDLDSQSIKTHCNGKHCGRCVVLLNNKAVLACLTPAFMIKNCKIQTFDNFVKSRDYRDIDKAYSTLATYPCPNCLSSQTMLIESIVRRYESNNIPIDEESVLQDSTLIKCHCIDSSSFLQITKESIANRRKRNVRRA